MARKNVKNFLYLHKTKSLNARCDKF